MTKKKTLKTIAFIIALLLVILITILANAMVGNPISKYLATKSANDYVFKTYNDTDFIIEKVNHNFKTGGYYARIISPSSYDTQFSIEIDQFGNIKHDYYENSVLSGWNTFMRCNDGYGALGDTVFNLPDFPYKSSIEYTSFLGDREKMEAIEEILLQLDQEFDYEQLGKEFGKLVFTAQDEEVTLEKVSEIMLGLKEIFDREQVYFHEIDFILEKTWVDGKKNFDEPEIRIDEFLYSDIYSAGMLDRVTKANKETIAYYETQDEKMANHIPENIDT